MKLGWCAVLVVAAACKKASPPAAPPATGSGSGSGSATASPPPPPAGVPALTGGRDRAFVAGQDGLVEVSDAGGSQVVAPGEVRWCNVDARGNVVWFATKDGLRGFDLEDRQIRPIISADLDEIEVIVNWGKEQLGGEDEVGFHAGVELAMTGTPALAQKVGCEGDAMHYCYEDADETKPTDDLKAALARVTAMKLADPAYVANVAKRGASRSLWTPPPVPPKAPKAPKVPKQACEEEPDDCGKLTAIPGSALWLVTTANSRGDFYHETRELYDPATGELLAVVDGKLVRSNQPRGEGPDFSNLRVGAGGTLSYDGVVFDPTKVIYAAKGDSARSCGWASGGWRIPSIRD